MATRIERSLRYRNKAEEVLAIAEGMKSQETKTFLQGVAADYQMLADSLVRMAEADASKSA
jgi:hypothetical protein